MKIANNAADQGTSRANRVRPKPVVKSKLRHSEYLSRLKKMAGPSHYRNYRQSKTSPSNNIFRGNNVHMPLPPLPLVASVEHATPRKAISGYDSAKPSAQYCADSEQHPELSKGILLLTEIHNIFRAKKVSKIRSKNLIAMLCTNIFWATYCGGKKINSRRLNKILQVEFGIHSKDIRFKAGVFKGFNRKTITTACRRLNIL